MPAAGSAGRSPSRLASEGAAVVGSQRGVAEGEELARSLAAEGLELAFVAADVRDERDGERLVGETLERYGRDRHPLQQRRASAC